MKRKIKRKLLVIKNGWLAHRGRPARRSYFHRTIQIERLPGDAPKLSPTGALEQHKFPNLCAEDLSRPADVAPKQLQSAQRRLTLITAFWKRARLLL